MTLATSSQPSTSWQGRTTRFWPYPPSSKQLAALSLQNVREVFYGGQAGGGKSDWLLMEASLYADNPNSHSILLRRTYPDLTKSGALLDRAQQWWIPQGVRYLREQHKFVFPHPSGAYVSGPHYGGAIGGSTVEFGHLQYESDKFNYQGGEWTMIGFDEAGQLRPVDIEFVSSRLRSTAETLPLRIRLASNPGNIAHEWLKDRFVDAPNTTQRVFVPATLDDNPSEHFRAEYEESLKVLDEVMYRQLRWGDWEIVVGTGWIEVDKIRLAEPPAWKRMVRFWDTAATPPNPHTPDPDWTCGLLMGTDGEGHFHIYDVHWMREGPGMVQDAIRRTAERDGVGIEVGYEQAKASAGKQEVHSLARYLSGFDFHPRLVTGDKEVRARPFVGAVRNEQVTHSLPRDQWDRLKFHLSQFPTKGVHDDGVDACSGAYAMLARTKMRFEQWL